MTTAKVSKRRMNKIVQEQKRRDEEIKSNPAYVFFQKDSELATRMKDFYVKGVGDVLDMLLKIRNELNQLRGCVIRKLQFKEQLNSGNIVEKRSHDGKVLTRMELESWTIDTEHAMYVHRTNIEKYMYQLLYNHVNEQEFDLEKFEQYYGEIDKEAKACGVRLFANNYEDYIKLLPQDKQ